MQFQNYIKMCKQFITPVGRATIILKKLSAEHFLTFWIVDQKLKKSVKKIIGEEIIDEKIIDQKIIDENTCS